MDGEPRLAVGGQSDAHRACRPVRVDLHRLGRQAQEPEPLEHLAAQVVIADPRHQPCEGTERAAVKAEIGGGPAKLFAGRQQVPEHLADRENLAAMARPRIPLAASAACRNGQDIETPGAMARKKPKNATRPSAWP